MNEKCPVDLLTEDHLIRGFELDLDLVTGQSKLIKDNIVFDLTNYEPKDVDFAILIPYKYG